MATAVQRWIVMGMREKLIALLKNTRANAAWHRWGFEESVDHLIANDVVQVVRCKDCKYYADYGRVCDCVKYEGMNLPNDNDFCSHGERKDNDCC